MRILINKSFNTTEFNHPSRLSSSDDPGADSILESTSPPQAPSLLLAPVGSTDLSTCVDAFESTGDDYNGPNSFQSNRPDPNLMSFSARLSTYKNSEGPNFKEMFKALRVSIANAIIDNNVHEFQRLSAAYYASLTAQMNGLSETSLIERCYAALKPQDIGIELDPFKKDESKTEFPALVATISEREEASLRAIDGYRSRDFEDTKKLAVILEPYIERCSSHVEPPTLEHVRGKDVDAHALFDDEVHAYLQTVSIETATHMIHLICQRCILEVSLPVHLSSSRFIDLCLQIIFVWSVHPDAEHRKLITDNIRRIRTFASTIVGSGNPTLLTTSLQYALFILAESNRVEFCINIQEWSQMYARIHGDVFPILNGFLKHLRTFDPISAQNGHAADILPMYCHVIDNHLRVCDLVLREGQGHFVLSALRSLPDMLSVFIEIVQNSFDVHNSSLLCLIRSIYNIVASYTFGLQRLSSHMVFNVWRSNDPQLLNEIMEDIVRKIIVLSNALLIGQTKQDAFIAYAFIDHATRICRMNNFRLEANEMNVERLTVQDIYSNLISNLIAEIGRSSSDPDALPSNALLYSLALVMQDAGIVLSSTLSTSSSRKSLRKSTVVKKPLVFTILEDITSHVTLITKYRNILAAATSEKDYKGCFNTAHQDFLMSVETILQNRVMNDAVYEDRELVEDLKQVFKRVYKKGNISDLGMSLINGSDWMADLNNSVHMDEDPEDLLHFYVAK